MAANLIEGEDARGVPVEHRGVVDVVPTPFQRRSDREVLDRHVRRAGRGELRREVADVAGMQAGAVDQRSAPPRSSPQGGS